MVWQREYPGCVLYADKANVFVHGRTDCPQIMGEVSIVEFNLDSSRQRRLGKLHTRAISQLNGELTGKAKVIDPPHLTWVDRWLKWRRPLKPGDWVEFEVRDNCVTIRLP